MLTKIKAYLGVGLVAFLSILGFIIKSKAGRIKELELQLKRDAMEKDLADARKAVADHRDKVAEKEQASRDAELNYRHAAKLYQAAKDGGSK